MRATHLRLYDFLPSSYANGPGRRAVVWVQGCSLGCAGCFNPETHPFSAGEWMPVAALLERLVALQETIAGVTVSGGEPLQQAPAVTVLLEGLRRETRLSIVLFTGFEWREIRRLPQFPRLVGNLDVLIAGRYQAARRLGRGLIGSANKTIHYLTSRYNPADFNDLPEAEVIISPQGNIILSGIDPLEWST
jgi:anaerobic ribonucleoside-triphosphate reductase activating protein